MVDFEFDRSDNYFIYHQFNHNLQSGPHFHTSFEFVYVLSGSLTVHINKCAYELTADNAALILPEEIHWYDTKDKAESYLCIFSPDYLADFSSFVGNAELVNPVFYFDDKKGIERFSDKNCSLYLQKAFLYKVCGLAAEAGMRKTKLTKDNQIVYKMMEYINANYKDTITLKQMAKDLGYNYVYISSFFNKHLSTGFSKFVNEHRINYAKILLKQGNLNVTQIASECGFLSLRNFNRAFLQIEHTSPKEYRLKAEKKV